MRVPLLLMLPLMAHRPFSFCAAGREAACRERRHPAARASPSLQNHRSPFEVLILVWP